MASVLEEVEKKKTKDGSGNLQREIFGEFHHLVQRDLEVDEVKFFKYFPLNKNEIHEVLNIIKDDIQKTYTTWRRVISPND